MYTTFCQPFTLNSQGNLTSRSIIVIIYLYCLATYNFRRPKYQTLGGHVMNENTRVPFCFSAKDIWDPKSLERLGFTHTKDLNGKYATLLPPGWTFRHSGCAWVIFYDSDGRARVTYCRNLGMYIRG